MRILKMTNKAKTEYSVGDRVFYVNTHCTKIESSIITAIHNGNYYLRNGTWYAKDFKDFFSTEKELIVFLKKEEKENRENLKDDIKNKKKYKNELCGKYMDIKLTAESDMERLVENIDNERHNIWKMEKRLSQMEDAKFREIAIECKNNVLKNDTD